MKYRMIEVEVVDNNGHVWYCRPQYRVQSRFLWFFWITLKCFSEREYAQSYLDALNNRK